MSDFPEGARFLSPAAHGGGSLVGGPARCTWHITWDALDPRPAFEDVGHYLISKNYEPTILWNPEDGDIIGMVPASHSAYAVVHSGSPETNRYGDVHVQIEVYFSPGVNGLRLFTDGPMVGLDRIMTWLDDLGIPRKAACDWNNPSRDVSQWLNNAGHFGHFAVPENTHSDPIAGTDINKILAGGASAPVPTPVEDDMKYTYAIRSGGTVVSALFPDHTHVPITSFNAFEGGDMAEIFFKTLGLTRVDYAVTKSITDGEGTTRPVWEIGTATADAIGLP